MTIRQYVMLRYIRENGPLSVEECITLRQRTFGSLCTNQWIEYNVRAAAFHVSKLGRHNLNEVVKLRRPTNKTMEWSSLVPAFIKPSNVIVFRRRRAA